MLHTSTGVNPTRSTVHLLRRSQPKREEGLLVITLFGCELLSSPCIKVTCPPEVRAACIDIRCCLSDTALEIERLCQTIRDGFDIDCWSAMPVLSVAILNLLKILQGCIERATRVCVVCSMIPRKEPFRYGKMSCPVSA
jgi:hypothetical protein